MSQQLFDRTFCKKNLLQKVLKCCGKFLVAEEFFPPQKNSSATKKFTAAKKLFQN